jgi:aspartyl aminopeptidase
MTKNYGCGLEKCRTYYFENIEYDKKDREKLGVLFYDFHDFIVKNPLTTDKNINEILKFFEKNNYKTIKKTEAKIEFSTCFHRKNESKVITFIILRDS